MAVLRPRRVAPIRQTGGQDIRQAELALDLAQEQHPAIRRQRPAIEAGMDIEALDG